MPCDGLQPGVGDFQTRDLYFTTLKWSQARFDRHGTRGCHMTPAGVVTPASYISVDSIQFERYHVLNQVRRCSLGCRRNVGPITTAKLTQTPFSIRMTPASVMGGTRGCHRPFWSARGEFWQSPIYFDMGNNLAIDVAKCGCVAMLHGQS